VFKVLIFVSPAETFTTCLSESMFSCAVAERLKQRNSNPKKDRIISGKVNAQTSRKQTFSVRKAPA
jgi:hypothetical protein